MAYVSEMQDGALRLREGFGPLFSAPIPARCTTARAYRDSGSR